MRAPPPARPLPDTARKERNDRSVVPAPPRSSRIGQRLRDGLSVRSTASHQSGVMPRRQLAASISVIPGSANSFTSRHQPVLVRPEPIRVRCRPGAASCRGGAAARGACSACRLQLRPHSVVAARPSFPPVARVDVPHVPALVPCAVPIHHPHHPVHRRRARKTPVPQGLDAASLRLVPVHPAPESPLANPRQLRRPRLRQTTLRPHRIRILEQHQPPILSPFRQAHAASQSHSRLETVQPDTLFFLYTDSHKLLTVGRRLYMIETLRKL